MIIFSSQNEFLGSFFPQGTGFRSSITFWWPSFLARSYAVSPWDQWTFRPLECAFEVPYSQKNHCGCGQKSSKTLMHMMKQVRTTWEVCWSLCQTPEGTSLESQTAQSSGEVSSMTETVPPQLLFTGCTFLC